ncbi:MAG: RNA polymerase sigma factor (sigma-70 family) [Kiritimatiellia bacterium]
MGAALAEATDEELMERYVARGDRAAFEQIFRSYAPRLHGLFRRSTGSEAKAQDLVQQTFLHVHRARRDFRRGAKLRPWLFAIAMNVRREHFRKRGRAEEVSLDYDRHGEPAQAPDASTASERAVRRALERLPEAQREVVLLHYYEDMSFGEVAKAVGASRSAVKVRAHRAYKVLRDILGGTDEPVRHPEKETS